MGYNYQYKQIILQILQKIKNKYVLFLYKFFPAISPVISKHGYDQFFFIKDSEGRQDLRRPEGKTVGCVVILSVDDPNCIAGSGQVIQYP